MIGSTSFMSSSPKLGIHPRKQNPAKCNSALQILLYLDTLHEEGSCVEASISFHDHLADVSVAEWDRLRERIAWYSDDNGDPIMASTEAQETT